VNKDEWTPLMAACAEGKTEVIKYLIHVGANMELRSNDGMSCLHLAAKNGHLEAVHVILTSGELAVRKKLLNQTVSRILQILVNSKINLGFKRTRQTGCFKIQTELVIT
jgi:ankyrin repeat protein